MQDISNENNNNFYNTFKKELALDLSTINIETELQCFEGDGMNFIECDENNCKNDIAFILVSMEDSTTDSIKIHTESHESNNDWEDECDEILSILHRDIKQLTKSTPLVKLRKDTYAVLSTSSTNQFGNNKGVIVHRPIPRRKNVSN